MLQRQKSHQKPSSECAFILWSKDTSKRSLSQHHATELNSPGIFQRCCYSVIKQKHEGQSREALIWYSEAKDGGDTA